jgi:predicted nuclease with TOPRIM domain
MKILLRVGLIVAVVAGLAALGFWWPIQEKITGLKANLDQTTKERDDTRAELATTKTDLANTKSELEKTTAELASTKSQLDDTTKKANDLETRLAKASSDLQKANGDLRAARESLRDWTALGQLEAVKRRLAEFIKVKEERDAIIEEKKILQAAYEKVDRQLNDLLGDERPVELPAGLKGRIIQVDPKYEFVVLNIGEGAGVKERGELLINRNGKYVGKVKVLSVTKDQSIANVMRTFKQDEPIEGDEVLY